MKCQELAELLFDYLNGELTPEQDAALHPETDNCDLECVRLGRLRAQKCRCTQQDAAAHEQAGFHKIAAIDASFRIRRSRRRHSGLEGRSLFTGDRIF